MDKHSKCSTEQGAGKNFGDTTFGNGAKAHLGDVSHQSQDVNIHGGIHINVGGALPLQAITAAGKVVSALDIADRLLRLVDQLTFSIGPVPRNLVASIIPLLQNFRNASDGLSEGGHLGVGRDFPALIDEVHLQLDHVLRILGPIALEFSESDTERRLKTMWSRFQTLWGDNKLDVVLERALLLRTTLNQQLLKLLNIDQGRINPVKRGFDAQTATENIVEVLTLNRSASDGLEPTAALITLQDGTTRSLSLDHKTRRRTDNSPTTKVIRYHADEQATSTRLASDSKGALIAEIPNYQLAIVRKLHFREEDDRRSEVKEAHAKTFSWIFATDDTAICPRFRHWLKAGKNCFWMNGKAGSGKSTLMKYIYQHPALKENLQCWAGDRQLIVCSFFFWHAGTPLQKSHEGTLRSILRQIINARPDLTTLLFPGLSRHLLLHPKIDELDISSSELQNALESLAKEMPSDLALFLLIDGVDEYVGDHHDFSKFLVRIAQSNGIKILASSRPLPACRQAFSKSDNLRLQDLTFGDIETYVEEELVQEESFQDMECLEPGFAEEISEKLVKKANGVFLWIVLVVRRLLMRLSNFDSKEQLLATVEELPPSLESLYDHMFMGMSKRYQQEGSLYLQLLAHSHEAQVLALTAAQVFVIDKHIQGIDTLAIPAYRIAEARARADVRIAARAQEIKQSRAEFGLAPVNSSNIESRFSLELVKEEEEELKRQVEAEIKAVDGKLQSRCWGLLEVQYTAHTGSLAEPKVDFLHRTVYDYVRDVEIGRKLNELYQCQPSELDLALLAGWTFRLKRRVESATARDYEVVVANVVECLFYARNLDAEGVDYFEYFGQIEKLYVGYVKNATIELQSTMSGFREEWEQNFFETAWGATRTGLQQPWNVILQRLRTRPGCPDFVKVQPLTTSTSALATTIQCGLYLTSQKLLHEKYSHDCAEDDLLICALHALVFGELKSEAAKACYKCCQSLLKDFSVSKGENRPLLVQSGSKEGKTRWISTAQVEHSVNKSWRFWIKYCTANTPFLLEVTLQFLQKGSVGIQDESDQEPFLDFRSRIESSMAPSSTILRAQVLNILRDLADKRWGQTSSRTPSPVLQPLIKRKASDGENETRDRPRNKRSAMAWDRFIADPEEVAESPDLFGSTYYLDDSDDAELFTGI